MKKQLQSRQPVNQSKIMHYKMQSKVMKGRKQNPGKQVQHNSFQHSMYHKIITRDGSVERKGGDGDEDVPVRESELHEDRAVWKASVNYRKPEIMHSRNPSKLDSGLCNERTENLYESKAYFSNDPNVSNPNLHKQNFSQLRREAKLPTLVLDDPENI